MSTFKNLAGIYFGRLRARWPVGITSRGGIFWLCSCKCGVLLIVRRHHLMNGHTKSCGCIVKKYGPSSIRKTVEYMAFHNAKDRCTNKHNHAYQRYGGRGIEFRFTSFEQFLAHIGPRPAGRSLDRFPDNDGHYELGNVRWATPKEQQNNRGRKGA